ncbi:MAG: GDP-mannose 4,6-dehydratase [Breznakibacter sp.]|nr:GDP-mannose 4,6-dehydratase [Breznakibacter sp.]
MEYVLVTGAAGFIGSHLCERLISDGYAVVGVDNFDPFYARTIKERNLANLIYHPNFTLIEVDLRFCLLEEVLNSFKFSYVIHLAGKVGVRPSIEHPQDYVDHNISVTLRVLEYMRKSKIDKLIFASSSSIYGNNPSAPWTEELDVSEPVSPYAFSKKSCELLNYTYHYLYNIDILNLRFFTVYGPRQRPDLAIAKFFKLIKDSLPLPVYGDGSTKRDYTYIADIIDGIVLSMSYLLKNKKVYEVINLGNGNPVSMSELIDQLRRVFSEDIRIQYLPEQQGDVRLTSADISKAKGLIGFNPKVDFSSGLDAFLKSL